MTLLAAARAKDGIVAISDRKESVDESLSNEVTKYYADAAGGFYIALAGDGTAARHLLNRLSRSEVASGGIFRELDRLAVELYVDHQKAGHVAGHLIVANRGKLEVYTVSIVSGIAVFAPNRDALPVEGDYGAIVLCKDYARDMSLPDMSCETAAKCLHTIAGRIAETIDSVGERDIYGIDVVVLAASGAITKMARRTDEMGTLTIRFSEYGAEAPSRNGGV